LKVTIPFIAFVLELYYAGGSNLCPSDTARAGHFYVSHIYNWANAWCLLTFMLAGIIDLVGRYVDLPTGTQHFFTAAAFLLQSFILVEGQHADMLEDMVYYMLFLLVASTAAFMVAEMIWPDSFLVSCGKLYCMYMQGIWYLSIARIIYGNVPAWSTTKPLPDMAPAMFVPVPFVFWMNFTSLMLVGVYMLLRWVFKAHLNEMLALNSTMDRPEDLGHAHVAVGGKGSNGVFSALPTSTKDVSAHHEMVPLVSRMG